ncbi:hypothetical protein BKK81_10100 [Cupriavidus sp. USMAHM13]|uniref:hypothetical protein n=1 Tax=Cupriavidus sp. USMAHM13 TaxID=1389192 RepID=UPI0008A70491|nr:hypothetical protein [Cupriavidus sp. USMAHM13]AOY99576.1 hypothetical protein BKK81_10100 [Cupriavidus sp. USMAHM13]
MQQRYEIWEILPDGSPRVSIESVLEDWEGFRLLLRNHETDRILRLAFASPAAYQRRDESDLDGEAARSTGLGRGCFYRVRQSEYLARFAADTCRQFDGLQHFAVITETLCVDVLAVGEPTVEAL